MNLANIRHYDNAKWHDVAHGAKQKIETRLLIDGKFVDAAKGGRFVTTNPANGEALAEMSAATAEDIDRAVAAAKQAFRSGVWSRMAPRQRMEVLYRFADLVDENAEQLAVLETLDMGKPIRILDLAKELIRLSGLEPDKDIPILFTQPRSGEKMSEELFDEKEKSEPTKHNKIFETKINFSKEGFLKKVDDLVRMAENGESDDELREFLWKIIE